MKSLVYQILSPKKLERHLFHLNVDSLDQDEIYAETRFSIVSTGTEIAAWLGAPPLRPTKEVYPRFVGYCNLAKVIKVGDDVQAVSKGDYILTHQSHRDAFICNETEVLLCFDSYNKSLLKKLTATYLYHLGYCALLKGNYKPGLTVAIVGMGVLGSTLTQLVKVFAGQPVCFTNQNQQFFKNTLQVSNVYPKTIEKGKCYTRDGTLGGFDLVINTSNQWNDHLFSMQLARKGGIIVNLGFPGRGYDRPQFNPLDSQYFYDKQLDIRQCGHVAELDVDPIDIRFTLKRNMRYLASLIEENLIDPNKIISSEHSWQNLEDVYDILSKRKEGIHSALLDWTI